MDLPGISTVKFTDITSTPAVQNRVRIAQAVITRHATNLVLSLAHLAAREIREKIPASATAGPAVYFYQESLRPGKTPSILKQIGRAVTLALLKAGDCHGLKAYAFLSRFIRTLPEGSLVITDKELEACPEKPTPVPFSKELCDACYGYSEGKVFFYSPRVKSRH